MKFFKPVVLSFILIAFGFKSFAQKPTFNYVITQKGDTIKCDFKKPLLGKIRYQPIGVKGYTKVTTDSIKEYYTVKDSTTNVAIILPDYSDPEFVVRLERGHINMYQQIIVTYSQYGNTTTYYWFINKDDGPLKQLKATTIFTDGSRKERKAMFSEMIADDTTLQGQFNADTDFSLKRLQFYVHQYNEDRTASAKPTGK